MRWGCIGQRASGAPLKSGKDVVAVCVSGVRNNLHCPMLVQPLQFAHSAACPASVGIRVLLNRRRTSFNVLDLHGVPITLSVASADGVVRGIVTVVRALITVLYRPEGRAAAQGQSSDSNADPR